MRWLKPGSTAWLLARELRLGWRSTKVSRWGRSRTVRLGIVVLAVTVQAIGLVVAWTILGGPAPDDRLRQNQHGFLAWFIPVFAGTALTGARTMLASPDASLLLTSPIPLRRVLLARIMTVPLRVATGWPLIFVVVPVVNGLAILGRPSALLAYPVLMAFAVVASSVTLTVTLTVIAAFGRLAGSVITILLAAALLVVALVGGSLATRAILPEDAAGWTAGGLQAAVAFLMRGIAGQPGALVAIVALGLALPYAAAWAFEGHYRKISILFLTSGTTRSTAARSPVRFRRRPGAVLWRKELALLWRRPSWLLPQMALFASMAFFMREAAENPASGSSVLVATMTAAIGSFARAAVLASRDGDGAAEVFLSSPTPLRVLRSAKIYAIGLFVAGFVAVLTLGLALVATRAVTILLTTGVGAATCALWLALREPGPVSWRDLAGARADMSGTRVVGWMSNLAWAFAGFVLVTMTIR